MWRVELHEVFAKEIEAWPRPVQLALAARLLLLEEFGPQLGRPHVDTLAGGSMPNLKELRFAVDRNPWRIAFAFDRARVAILLCGGRKSGIADARFYKRLIATAEARWFTHEE